MIPLLEVLPQFPAVHLQHEAIDRLLNGVPPQKQEADLPDRLEEGQFVRLTDGDKLLGIAAYAPSRKKEKRGDFELAKVFTLGQ